MRRLLEQEDTVGDKKITVRDTGPKAFELLCAETGRAVRVEGTAALSVLLQELAAQLLQVKVKEEDGGSEGRSGAARLDLFTILHESTAARITRKIRYSFWAALTRRLDGEGIAQALVDSKVSDTGEGGGSQMNERTKGRIFVPAADGPTLRYLQAVAAKTADALSSQSCSQLSGIEVVTLPPPCDISPALIKSLQSTPGLLALASDEATGHPIPFCVPGGRFNEMYC